MEDEIEKQVTTPTNLQDSILNILSSGDMSKTAIAAALDKKPRTVEGALKGLLVMEKIGARGAINAPNRTYFVKALPELVTDVSLFPHT